MDNDLIKQQIESAKKAYISGMAKQHSDTFSEQNATGPTTVTNLSQFEQQSAIMARLKSLMDEAAQTPRLTKRQEGISRCPIQLLKLTMQSKIKALLGPTANRYPAIRTICCAYPPTGGFHAATAIRRG